MSRKLVIFVILIVAIVGAAIFMGWFFYLHHNKKQPIASKAAGGITWGVDFSQSQAEYLGLDWKQLYLAMLNDLKVKHIKLHVDWNWVEGTQDQFYFQDTDWQVQQAEQHGAKLIYVVGMKTGRWPECHIPDWANGLSAAQQQQAVLSYLTQTVNRYKNIKAIQYWQVENEPLFKFGQCPPWYYQNSDFLKEEVALVHALDPSRQVIISDSGELSTWFNAASIGDIVGITMYRKAYTHVVGKFGFTSTYEFISPQVYKGKAQLIQKEFGKKVLCIELQAEPWASKPLLDAPLNEQAISMNPQLFEENVAFAKQTGLDTFYFWGVEWWYWMKEVHNQPGIWDEAKPVFASGS